MNPSKIKPALIVLLKAYPNMTAERLCFMTGFPPDSVRRVLREDPCFVAAGPKTINGRVWTYNPDGERPPKQPKVDPAITQQYKANGLERERTRLNRGYVTGVRIQWGDIVI